MVNRSPLVTFSTARPLGRGPLGCQSLGRRSLGQVCRHAHNRRPAALISAALLLAGLLPAGAANAAQLRAGVAKADITDREAGPVNDPLYAKALVLNDGTTTLAIITVDAVSLGEIGYISNDYLPTVRSRI